MKNMEVFTMITQDSLQEVFSRKYETNQMYPAFSAKAPKRWRGTIGRMLQALVETENI
jgi:hypothetical protein